MMRKCLCCAIVCLLLAWVRAGAAEPELPGPAALPWPGLEALTAQAQPQPSPTPPADQPPREQPPRPQEPRQPSQDQLQQALRERRESLRSFNPRMIGDFPGVFGLQTVTVPSVRTLTTIRNVTQTTLVNVPSFTPVTTLQTIRVTSPPGVNPPFDVPVQVPVTTLQPITLQLPVTTTTQVRGQRQVPVLVQEKVLVPLPFTGPFKIADNEAPAPEDRVFLGYNFYSNVTGPGGATPVGPLPEGTVVPAVASPRLDIHREFIGFEKTLFDGLASVGLRAPGAQAEGDTFAGSGFGDVTGVFKVNLFQDLDAGMLLSGGLALTAPTGRDLRTVAGDVHPVLVQPFMGYRFGTDGLFLFGFTSVAVPTDATFPTLLFNDVGVGYPLYRGPATQLLDSVVPVFEVHVTTPLNNRDPGALVSVPDLVVLTEGVQLGLYGRATLTLGVAAPVTGPRIFDVEAIAQFNLRF